MKRWYAAIATCIFLSAIKVAGVKTSAHWGYDGEKWSPRGPLSDWGYAGYAANEASIPSAPGSGTVFDVTSTKYGAKADGVTDATYAIQRAINDAGVAGGIVKLTSGTFLVTSKIYVNYSNIVLRGAGAANTFIYIPYNLSKVYGPKGYYDTNGVFKTTYSFGEAFIEARPTPPPISVPVIANVMTVADRGHRRIYLSTTATLTVGQWIQVVMDDVNGGLYTYLYDGSPTNITDILNDKEVVRFASRITTIGSDGYGYFIDLERPLAHVVRPEWRARIGPLTSFQNVGIEDLSVKFAKYNVAAHFSEEGFNAIVFQRARNVWARNINIYNADLGLNFQKCDFGTASNILVTVTSDRSGIYSQQGHHAVNFGGCTEMDASGINVPYYFRHDVSFEKSSNVVVRDSKGGNFAIDCHKVAPHQLLLANIDVGTGSKYFDPYSGRDDRGRNAGSNVTVWKWTNSAGTAVNPAACLYAQKMVWVGNYASSTSNCVSTNSWSVEYGSSITPTNLYAEMVRTRARRILPFADLKLNRTNSIKSATATTNPYMRVSSTNSIYMASTSQTFKFYLHSSGNLVLTPNDGASWLSGESTGCTKLVGYPGRSANYAYFSLSKISGTNPQQYKLKNKCKKETDSSPVTRYVKGDLTLTTTSSSAAKFLLV